MPALALCPDPVSPRTVAAAGASGRAPARQPPEAVGLVAGAARCADAGLGQDPAPPGRLPRPRGWGRSRSGESTQYTPPQEAVPGLGPWPARYCAPDGAP